MTQQQNPLERAVDLFVFAPIGVAMFARDTVPTFLKMFVSRGQTELAHRKKSLHDQANQYRAVGKFAVKYGGPEVKRQAEGRIDGARRLAEETFTGLVVPRLPNQPETPAPKTPAPKTPPPKTSAPTAPPAAKAKPAAAPPPATKGGTIGNGAKAPAKNGNGNGVAAAPPDLAIPGYDQLSASQVVERLDGLTPEELEAVREYEQAHRGRATILGKILQLSG